MRLAVNHGEGLALRPGEGHAVHLPGPSEQQLEGSPRELVGALSVCWGDAHVAEYCADLLEGADPMGCPEALLYIGGRGAAGLLGRDDRVEALRYWPRVWAARALRYAWSPSAVPALVAAVDDEAWRVAEQAMKVMTKYEVGEGVEAALAWVDHPLPRVRATVLGLVAAVGESEHVDHVLEGLQDPDPQVRRAAEKAVTRLERRLDVGLQR
jgi:HEAT repeat